MANTKSRKTTTKTTGKEPKSKTTKASEKTSAKKTTNSNRKTKAKSKAEKPNFYEIKLLGLIAYTLLSIVSLHTDSAGAIGKFISDFYFGLFAFAGYFIPYALFGCIFISLNKNFMEVRFRYVSSLILGYSAIVLMISMFGVNNIPADIYTKDGLRVAYNLGLKGLGGGVVGSSLARFLINAVGSSGVYIIILSLILLVMLLCTKMTITKLMALLKGQAVKTGESIGETLIEAKNNVAETLATDDTTKVRMKKRSLMNLTKQENFEDLEQGTASASSNESSEEEIKIIDFNMGSSKSKGEPSFLAKKEEPVIAFAEAHDASKDTSPVKASEDSQTETKPTPSEATAKKVRKTKDGSQELSNDEKEAMETELDTNVELEYEHYIIPSPSLLNPSKNNSSEKDRKDILMKARLLEDTLNNFGVDAKVVQISKGPTITRFEIQPSPGVKVSKIVNLSDDIALNLAAHHVRIVAPIPGKAAVGIEVPNKTTSLVTLREVLETEAFDQDDSKMTFGLGKDISGTPIAADLSKMPHLLVAGATGSGKSVCVNTMITSILCNAKPDEVKFLMIDPKVVELNIYNGIPHLILPVVTDPKKASVALNWAVQEMTDRYNRFAEAGVRDITGYNKKVEEYNQGKKMTKIVVIIDELADLMMVAPNAVEDAICRLAQMARAAGIHLIVATQRPSVDVITGVIKANIPSRIAFAVSSQVDSRTIIDMGGAEKLLGKGDMLYYPVGSSKPQRVQGAFVSEQEVEKIVEAVKEQVEPVEYDQNLLETVKSNIEKNENTDEYLTDAIELVIDAEQASVSMLQRKFRIGYNRAARLVDELEERGIVGPSLGSKPRNVLMTRAEYEALNAETNE